MKTQVIIPAAGAGVRLKSGIPKPLVLLKGKPLLVYSLEVFERCPLVESIIVVAGEQYLPDFDKVIQHYHFKKISSVIAGGATRSQSVSNGLKKLDKDTDIVLVHDGARPLVSLEVIERAIRLCYDEVAVITAVPVKPTIKRVNPRDLSVAATLDRDLLWEVQTPQIFKKDILLKAYNTAQNMRATDDAVLVERLGEKVSVVRGEYTNIKITSHEDLLIAESFLSNGKMKI